MTYISQSSDLLILKSVSYILTSYFRIMISMTQSLDFFTYFHMYYTHISLEPSAGPGVRIFSGLAEFSSFDDFFRKIKSSDHDTSFWNMVFWWGEGRGYGHFQGFCWIIIPTPEVPRQFLFHFICKAQFRWAMLSSTGLIMPPTSKKLEGHIASGLFVGPSVLLSIRPSVRHAFWCIA